MPASTPTLRDMILEAIDRGQTYEQLAAAANAAATDKRSSERVSRSMLNNIVLGKVDRMPYDYHLRAIATALGVPYERVRKAAIAQWLPAEGGAEENLLHEAQHLAELTARLLDKVGDSDKRRESA